MKTWYAVYTKQNAERKVIQQLIRKRVEYYFPINRIWQIGKMVHKPLFPSFIFVFTTDAELKKILKMTHVINPIYRINVPVTFSEQEMEHLRNFVENHINITIKKLISSDQEVAEDRHLQGNNNLQRVFADGSAIIMNKLGYVLTGERFVAATRKVQRNFGVAKMLLKFGFSSI
ncbi:MAG: UpxY family transcription antiterminator [Chitinophagaceae bacterium]|nr:UpxY family transcription antiterminator [Chitinophagaceae bacterium]